MKDITEDEKVTYSEFIAMVHDRINADGIAQSKKVTHTMVDEVIDTLMDCLADKKSVYLFPLGKISARYIPSRRIYGFTKDRAKRKMMKTAPHWTVRFKASSVIKRELNDK